MSTILRFTRSARTPAGRENRRNARWATGSRGGGQFEHYTEAKARLTIVVPLALSRIVFLLWLSFRSMRTALPIFLNVPFAIVGGAVALWLRGIPFSISAGVGFIALFRIAVVNGLVLVSFSRHLEERGMGHVEERVGRRSGRCPCPVRGSAIDGETSAERHESSDVTALLLDTSSIFFRAHHALPPMNTSTG